MQTMMLIAASALILAVTACGQSQKNVPVNVRSAFMTKFSNASKVKWSRENNNEWEAEFKLDGKEYSANFDNAGTWMETEYEVSLKDIPAEAKATLDKESAGFKIKESAVTETVEGKAYEFVISKGETEMELVIDINGNLKNKEQIKERDEKEEK
jgi:hypothetical protein